MNIYTQKQTWKISLLIAAVIIIASSLWYTSRLVRNIANVERRNVQLWAEAIQKKANLVKYTQELFYKLGVEERKKVQLWAMGTRQLANMEADLGDLSFVFEVVKNNETVPVILTDEKGTIISTRNLDSLKANDEAYLKEELKLMKSLHKPIEIEISQHKKNYLFYKDSRLFTELRNVMDDIIQSFISEIVINSASVPVIYTDGTKKEVLGYGNLDSTKIKNPNYIAQKIIQMSEQNQAIEVNLGGGIKHYVFYEDSYLLTQLKYYPFIQFGIIGVFLIIAYSLFSTARNAEQNQVWVGMSKETAHQLGTPLSSLMAWLEILKSKGVDEETTQEIEKDLYRLQTITERFSKIGSAPKLEEVDVVEVLNNAIGYLQSRVSQKVRFTVKSDNNKTVIVPLCVPLFDWVVENLVKNAVDAIGEGGSVNIHVMEDGYLVHIDVSDTGKGIAKANFKNVFEPGYTTKKRGWGLGLSLTKRIIENYHSGKIFVKESEPDKGTTFRITLKRNNLFGDR